MVNTAAIFRFSKEIKSLIARTFLSEIRYHMQALGNGTSQGDLGCDRIAPAKVSSFRRSIYSIGLSGFVSQNEGRLKS